MPTGYTAIIEDREDCTFEDYVWRCARAFGAFVMMRDEPLDAPVPAQFEADDYHAKGIAKAKKRLDDLKAIDAGQAAALAKEEHAAALRSNAASAAKQKAKLARYDAILAKVNAWEPPTSAHVELKKFMVQQIGVSTEFERGYVAPAPELLSGEAWLAKENAKAARDIAYHTEHDAKERARTAERNAWVTALAASVPIPKAVPR